MSHQEKHENVPLFDAMKRFERIEMQREQLESILKVVSSWRKINLDEELNALQPTVVGETIDISGERNYRTRVPDEKELESLKKSAEKKTEEGGYGFLKELLKTNPLLASLLFVFFVLALTAPVNPALPQIAGIFVWVVVISILAILGAAAWNFSKNVVKSWVTAAALAMKSPEGKGCRRASKGKIRWLAWEVWLSCGSPPEPRKFLVSFGGTVVPVQV